MQDFIFDFGTLEPSTELLYIQSMVRAVRVSGTGIDQDEQTIIANLIHRSQVILWALLKGNSLRGFSLNSLSIW